MIIDAKSLIISLIIVTIGNANRASSFTYGPTVLQSPRQSPRVYTTGDRRGDRRRKDRPVYMYKPYKDSAAPNCPVLHLVTIRYAFDATSLV